MSESWDTEPLTQETLDQFGSDFLDLCRKHKVLASAAVLQAVHETRPGIYVQVVGEKGMVEFVRSKIGLPWQGKQPFSESDMLAGLRSAVENREEEE